MRFSEEVKAALWELIDEMSLNVSEFTVHPEKDFTRKKKWDMIQGGAANADEIYYFYGKPVIKK